MDAAMEGKLRELLDRHEIHEVFMRFARGLDRFDIPLVRSCYFDDCIDDHYNYVGYPDDFINYANESARYFTSSQHHISTHSCELRGHDAYCESYFMFSGVRVEPPHFMSTGRYIDHLQKRNGEWRFASRITIVDGSYDLTESAMAKAHPGPYKPHEMQTIGRNKSDVSYLRPPIPRKPLPKAAE